MREKESGGGNVPAAKRPSRKHRRRASNLLAEYNRRYVLHQAFGSVKLGNFVSLFFCQVLLKILSIITEFYY